MKKPRKRKHTDWRVLAQGPKSAHFAHEEDRIEFDEVVVGEWLHVERMGTRQWWMRVGEVHLWVTLDRTGEALVTVTEGDEHLESGRVLAPAAKKGGRK